MNIIKNLSIRNKLFLIASVPVLVLFYFLISDLADKINTRKNIQNAYNLVQIENEVSDIVFELQLERAYSTILLASKGTFEKSNFASQCIETDNAIDELKKLLRANNESFESYSYLDNIPLLRDDIGLQQISADSAKNNYNIYTRRLLRSIDVQFSQLNNPEIKHLFDVLVDLLQSKDYMSRLRAVVGEAIITNGFKGNQFALYVSLKSKYESYLEEFRYNAPKEILVELNEKLSTSTVQKAIEEVGNKLKELQKLSIL